MRCDPPFPFFFLIVVAIIFFIYKLLSIGKEIKTTKKGPFFFLYVSFLGYFSVSLLRMGGSDASAETELHRAWKMTTTLAYFVRARVVCVCVFVRAPS